MQRASGPQPHVAARVDLLHRSNMPLSEYLRSLAWVLHPANMDQRYRRSQFAEWGARRADLEHYGWVDGGMRPAFDDFEAAMIAHIMVPPVGPNGFRLLDVMDDEGEIQLPLGGVISSPQSYVEAWVRGYMSRSRYLRMHEADTLGVRSRRFPLPAPVRDYPEVFLDF